MGSISPAGVVAIVAVELGRRVRRELSLRPPRLPVPQAAASTCASGCHAEAPI